MTENGDGMLCPTYVTSKCHQRSSSTYVTNAIFIRLKNYKNSLRKNNKNIISKFQILLLNCNSAAYIDGFSDNLDIKIIYWYILGILSLWQNHSRRFETRVTLILWKVELFYFIPLNELDEIILNQKKFKGYLRSLFFAYNWTLRTIISWWLILDVGEVFLNTDIFVTNTLSLAFFNFFRD